MPLRAGKWRQTGPEILTKPSSGKSENERMARLVREAARGYSRPAGKHPASREQEEDDILRDFLCRIFETDRKVRQEGQQTDKEALVTLYTARSFSSPEAMGRATGAVRELLQINRRVAAGLQMALGQVKGRIEAARWSDRDKVRFWREFAEGFESKFQFRFEVLESQELWAKATAEAYEFVLCHSDQLRFEGKAVHATSRETGREFIEKLKRAKRCREEFRAAAARFYKAQNAALVHWDVPTPPAS